MMGGVWVDRAWIADLFDRAVKTAAQVAVLTIGADVVNVFAVDWWEVFGMAAGGAALSVLTNVAHRGLSGEGSDDI